MKTTKNLHESLYIIKINFTLQKVAGLELREQELREEVVQANQLRKQQLVELGLLREEEKQKMNREHEGEVNIETLICP